MKAGAKKAMTKGALAKALATEHGLKQKACSDVLNSLADCHEGGEEDRRLHDPWLVPHQDPSKTSHESRSEECIRQGDEGRCEAGKDSCEGFLRGCIEEADLE